MVKDSKSHVASMSGDDFYGSKLPTIADATEFKIEFVAADGSKEELKGFAPLKAGEFRFIKIKYERFKSFLS